MCALKETHAGSVSYLMRGLTSVITQCCHCLACSYSYQEAVRAAGRRSSSSVPSPTRIAAAAATMGAAAAGAAPDNRRHHLMAASGPTTVINPCLWPLNPRVPPALLWARQVAAVSVAALPPPLLINPMSPHLLPRRHFGSRRPPLQPASVGGIPARRQERGGRRRQPSAKHSHPFQSHAARVAATVPLVVSMLGKFRSLCTVLASVVEMHCGHSK